jgi:hypothetical protein
MFAFGGDIYHGPLSSVDSSPQMTDAEMEAWAERANRFLNGAPNRAARVRPKYPASTSVQPSMTMLASFM